MTNLDLDAIKAPEEAKEEKPDDKTAAEIANLDAESKRLDNKGKKQDIEARKEYAWYIFVLICSWLGVMAVILFLAGFGRAYHWFILDDSVLIALVTTTTGSVLGLFVIVANYLFKGR